MPQSAYLAVNINIAAFGTGVGCTDYLYAMVTGTSWLLVPETIRFNLHGKLKKGVYARDLILTIIGRISANGANYKVTSNVKGAVEVSYVAPAKTSKKSYTVPATVKLSDGRAAKVTSIAPKAFAKCKKANPAFLDSV